ncbi:MAG: AAA family ATPase [Ruminococcus sp.]
MKPIVSIGNQDFRSIRENHNFYIDKTAFIKEWWENQDTVTLITRPRRFGKTLNMSMVENFSQFNPRRRRIFLQGLRFGRRSTGNFTANIR